MGLSLGLSLSLVGGSGPSANPLAPAATVAPAITPTTGDVGTVFTLSNGTWTNAPTFTRQWYNASGAIPGATGTTYTAVAGDRAGSIYAVVTGTSGAFTGTAASNSVTIPAAVVTLGTLTFSGVLVNGTPSSGTINGATTGSTITSPYAAALGLNSAARTYSFDGTLAAGSDPNGLVETLAGATNSPKSSAATVQPAAGATTFPATTNFVAIGDSFTAGSNEPDASTAWVGLLSTSLGATALNKGVGGTALQNTAKASTGLPDGGNMFDRFVADCLGSNARDVLIIAGGYNDARFISDNPLFTPAAYGAQLRQMFSKAIISGQYTRSKIVSFAPYWITDAGIATGYGAQTQPSPPRSSFDAYNTEWIAACAEYGVYGFNAYTYLRDNGYLPDTDKIHPQRTANGNKGHVLIRDGALVATQVMNALGSVVDLTASSTVGGRLDTAWTAFAGATSYEVEIAPTGTVIFTPVATPSTNSANITGLATGSSYIYRVRAVSGANKSPWSFYTTATTIAASADAVTDAYVAAMTVQPSAARKALLNNFIAGLRTDGVLTKLFGMGLLASHDAQAARLNVMNPGAGAGQLATVIGGETFTVDRGYQGDGTSGQIDTGLNFVGHQDDAAMGGYTLTPAVGTGSTVDMGNANSLMQFKGSSTSSIRLNAASGGGIAAPATAGFMAATQLSATSQAFVRPTGTESIVAVTSAVPDTGTIRVGGRSGTLNYSNRMMAFWFMGSGMTAADVIALRGRITTYLQGVGAI